MHGRMLLALLALMLLAPAGANAAVIHDPAGDARAKGVDIRRLEAVTSSAGAFVQVTLRAPLSGKIAVSFRRATGAAGTAAGTATLRRGRRVWFLFSGDARTLRRVIIRTRGRRGDRAALPLPRAQDGCAALALHARKLRALGRKRPAVKRRLRAIARRRTGLECAALPIPVDPPASPAPTPVPGFTPAAARFTLADGLTPEDPLAAGADVTFTDASQGTELTERTWDFGDGATASGTTVRHAFAQPGRYTVLLTVKNSRGHVSAFGQEVFVRGPGTTTFDAAPIACPAANQTAPVTIRLRVPSWAKLPAKVSYHFAVSCGRKPSEARGLAITPGNAGNHKDAWGRNESTMEFTFDITSGSAPPASVTPSVTASWS